MPAGLFAAYLLVLQSALGAFAFGLGPGMGQLDAFGNVICTHDGLAERPDGDQRPQGHVCCLLGCNLAGVAFGTPPATDGLAHLQWFGQSLQAVPASDPVTAGRQRSPANPRAPPALA